MVENRIDIIKQVYKLGQKAGEAFLKRDTELRNFYCEQFQKVRNLYFNEFGLGELKDSFDDGYKNETGVSQPMTEKFTARVF